MPMGKLSHSTHHPDRVSRSKWAPLLGAQQDGFLPVKLGHSDLGVDMEREGKLTGVILKTYWSSERMVGQCEVASRKLKKALRLRLRRLCPTSPRIKTMDLQIMGSSRMFRIGRASWCWLFCSPVPCLLSFCPFSTS